MSLSENCARSINFTIAGAGPSGLMAAWAAIQLGWSIQIYDPAGLADRPDAAGVFVLHDDCNLPLQHTMMRILPFGAPDDAAMRAAYADKVYGPNAIDACAVSVEPAGLKRVWNGRQALTLIREIIETMPPGTVGRRMAPFSGRCTTAALWT